MTGKKLTRFVAVVNEDVALWDGHLCHVGAELPS